MKNKNSLIRFWLVLMMLVAGLFLAACSSSEDSMENMDGMEEMDHAETPDRIPNEGGASITITSPQAGDTFNTLDQVIVEVEVENFELGGNNHWHVYVDGTSYGMVMGGNTDQALPGLEPGEHEISVFLSIETHEEYEDGDSVMIVVEE